MYKVDPTLFEKFKSNLQTKSNNNDPNPLVYITRNRTPVTTQRFWEKVRVTATVGTRSSIAVRRPEGNLTGDVIFVAQVEDGNAVIRRSDAMLSLTDMMFTHVATLNNVSELSIMFDGYMKMVEGKVESYTTGDLPVVFYVDSNNSLKGWNMNTDVTCTISDTAYNVASVRGLYSEAAELNDGIFVFYTNAEGELWEARVLNDEVTELTQITVKPEGVTGWVDVWASLTFDYRVVLQLKGNDGSIYTLLSYSRPSGFSLNEIIDYRVRLKKRPMLQCGSLPPVVYSIFNSIENPLVVKITFDNEVFIFNNNPMLVWMEGSDGQKRYPISIVKSKTKELTLTFSSDLVGLLGPHKLTDNPYNPCGFGSSDGISAIINTTEPILFNIDNRGTGTEVLNYGIVISENPQFILEKAFDGQMYMPDEVIIYSKSVKVMPTLELLNLSFPSGYMQDEIITYSKSIQTNPTWTMLNVDGTPI